MFVPCVLLLQHRVACFELLAVRAILQLVAIAIIHLPSGRNNAQQTLNYVYEFTFYFRVITIPTTEGSTMFFTYSSLNEAIAGVVKDKKTITGTRHS